MHSRLAQTSICSSVILLLSVTQGISQIPDARLISSEKELNFSLTKKRGIKADNGVVYFVEANGKTLTAYENNKIKWQSDIIDVCHEQKVGKSELRFIKLETGKISVVFGKHSFSDVDLADGKVTCTGTD